MLYLNSPRSAQGKDLFLFNSGDIVDGTGLAGATPIDGQLLPHIIRQVSSTPHIYGDSLL